MKLGKIIVIVAPSGSGKSTLIQRLKEEFPMIEESVSFTTRDVRKGEVDKVHYNFISEELFLKMIEKDDFIEWAQVHGNYYGTSKTFVEEALTKSALLLFDLDVQGTDAMKKYFGDQAKAIFIAPPSVEELKKRLHGRGTDSTGVIELRLENSKKELTRVNDYDFCVVNDQLERAYDKLKEIIQSILESD